MTAPASPGAKRLEQRHEVEAQLTAARHTPGPPGHPSAAANLVVELGRGWFGDAWQVPLAKMLKVKPFTIWRIEELSLLGFDHPEAMVHEARARATLALISEALGGAAARAEAVLTHAQLAPIEAPLTRRIRELRNRDPAQQP